MNDKIFFEIINSLLGIDDLNEKPVANINSLQVVDAYRHPLEPEDILGIRRELIFPDRFKEFLKVNLQKKLDSSVYLKIYPNGLVVYINNELGVFRFA